MLLTVLPKQKALSHATETPFPSLCPKTKNKPQRMSSQNRWKSSGRSQNMSRGQTWARSLLIIARSFFCQKEVEKESGTGMWLGTLPFRWVRQDY